MTIAIRWICIKEASWLAGVSTRTLRRWLVAGRLLAYRPAGCGGWRLAVDHLGRLQVAP